MMKLIFGRYLLWQLKFKGFKMSKRNVYFMLAIVGQFLPWFLEHGFNISLFFQEFFANGVASTIALDFIMVSVVVIVFIVFESKKLGMKKSLYTCTGNLGSCWVWFGSVFVYARKVL